MLRIKIYADGADIKQMELAYKEGLVKGFTTNPALMKKAGVKDYNQFAKDVIKSIPDLPLSLEVFADDFDTMRLEAKKIASFGKNVYVKIPITNTKGESSIPLIEELSEQGINLNITAIMTIDQVRDTVSVLANQAQSIVSVFAGRIADTGVDPLPIMKEAKQICSNNEHVELLWASSREALNIIQADKIGVDIITCTPEIIAKRKMFGKDLDELSLDTVKMFNADIKELGYSIL